MKTAIKILFTLVAILFGWLGYACYCKFDFNPNNSSGIIISALGVMVTALVGWQVFNAIEMRNIIKSYDDLKNSLTLQGLKHENKAQSLEWLISAISGELYTEEKFESRIHYLTHCLDVVLNFTKSGTQQDCPPFVRSIERIEELLDTIIDNQSQDEAKMLERRLKIVRKWRNETISIINTESQHLTLLKERIDRFYDKYVSFIIQTIGDNKQPQETTETNTINEGQEPSTPKNSVRTKHNRNKNKKDKKK